MTESLSGTSGVGPRRRGVFLEVFIRGEGFRWVLFAFAGFLAGELISTGFVSIVAALLGKGSQISSYATSSSPPSWYIICSLLGLWVGFIGAAVIAMNFGGVVKRRLGLVFRPIDFAGIAIGVGAQLGIGLLYLPFKSHLTHFNAPITKLTGSSHGASVAVIIVLTVVGAPIVEEIFFRGVLFRGLMGLSATAQTRNAKIAGIAVAMVVDGLLFGLAHGELVQLPGLAIFGVLLAFLFFRTGRLGMCIVAHLAFNSLALVSYFSSSGTIVPWH